MCGRFSLTHTPEELAEHFDVRVEALLAPRMNIAPTQPVLIVRENPHLFEREIAHVAWGLIPPWVNDPRIGARMINARSETVAVKPAFRHAIRRRRCLVPASGFYEWCPSSLEESLPQRSTALPDFFSGNTEPQRAPVTSRPKKQPFLFQMHLGQLFAFGGLWESWNGPNGEILESCSILTTAANTLVAGLHDRMPVIVRPDHYAIWLDVQNEDVEGLQRFFRPFPAEEMKKTPMEPPREELKRMRSM